MARNPIREDIGAERPIPRWEVVREPDPWVEHLAWLMDRSIPIGPWRIGLDGLLGLLPGAGDTLASLISAAIIVRGAQMGLPKSAIARMSLNVLLDALAGTVPVAGDLFDFAYKSNTRNVRIFREAMQGRRSSSNDWAFVTTVVLGLAAILILPFVIVFSLFKLF